MQNSKERSASGACGITLSVSRRLHLNLFPKCTHSRARIITVSIESAGQYKPEELVPEAITTLVSKIRGVRVALAAATGVA
jgi:hypothetical protein